MRTDPGPGTRFGRHDCLCIRVIQGVTGGKVNILEGYSTTIDKKTKCNNNHTFKKRLLRSNKIIFYSDYLQNDR